MVDDTLLDTSLQGETLITEQTDALTRLQNELKNFKKDPVERRTKNHVKNRLHRIEETRSLVFQRHQKLFELGISQSDDYFKSDFIDRFENLYIDVISQIQNQYEKWFPETISTPSVSTASNTPPASVSTTQSAANITVISNDPPFRLPELSIPQFSGNYIDWPAFHDAFLFVHNHERLSNGQKLQYLRNALSAKVKSLIGYLDITADNYQTVWDALIERYNNKRVLFNNYMDKFMNQESMTNDNANELQTLHDISRACIAGLKKLDINTDACSELFTFIIVKKFSSSTRLDWEKELGKSADIPKFTKIIEFLDTRFRTFEALLPQSTKTDSNKSSSTKHSSQPSNKFAARKEYKAFHIAAKSIQCPMCNQSHILRRCPNFLQLAPTERKSFVDKIKLCINCLGHNNSQSCISTKTCFTCGGKHHTLLHFIKHTPSSSNYQNVPGLQSSSNSNNITLPNNTDLNLAANHVVSAQASCVLLTTAIINIVDAVGNVLSFRALVDQCSQHSVITERAAQLLRLPIESICVGVRPMGETQYKIVNRGMQLQIRSRTDPSFDLNAIVAIMPSITSELPLYPLKAKQWAHVKNLPLADPHYDTPGQIDLLLAGDIYGKILESGLCKGQPGEPIAQNTALGWILSGEIAHQNHVSTIQIANNFHVSTIEIGHYIKKFYELEEVPQIKKLSDEDQWTERFYEQTTIRQPNGKFMVRLPLKSNFDSSAKLGASFSMALKRFQSLQRRFSHDNKFRESYTNTFNEYKQLNQVKLINNIIDDKQSSDQITHFYLPHHAVFKETSLTTKLRQVFDGSAKSSNGKSLNDILTKGPALQSDLVSIILNWRTLKYVFIADIEKMYRCIDVHPDDTKYQLLLWQDNDHSGIQTYALQTVTFGIISSPYQAIKTIQTLAKSESHKFPLAYSAIMNETYVDDVTTGHETISGAIELLTQLIHMLRTAGFELRKWSSNSREILNHIPKEYQQQQTECLLNPDENIKALGLAWSTTNDLFSFNIRFEIDDNKITKRTILSVVARLFDPLGWINPFVTKAKIFLNTLWEADLKWDEIPSIKFQNEWKDIVNQFQHLNKIKIPRWINTSSKNEFNELHIFCDSSQKAYATAAYLRTIDSEQNIHVNLIIAKSKLVPVRKPLTIPRSELCGAVLAVKLLDSIQAMLRLKIDQTFMWTDSSVVLSWIRGDPNRWAAFVCNRVHRILDSTQIEQWNHVISKDNPADCNSRGLSLTQLHDCDLWWKGPAWLSTPYEHWPKSNIDIVNDDNNELLSKFKSVNLVVNDMSQIDLLIHRSSNFNRLCRSVAYALRFVHATRNSIKNKSSKCAISNASVSLKQKIEKIPHLTVNEIQCAEHALLRWIQSIEFSNEISSINKQKSITKKSKLYQLNPFIDEHGLLRVNGRLQNAFMPFNEKFPIILPSNHRISLLIIDFHHRLTLHSGPRTTVNQIRQSYWILNVRTLTRNFIQKCVICFKHKPKLQSQLMGSLPFARVNEYSRPFASTLVDYAGPYSLRTSKGRGQTTYKGYVAVFVCMTTKAVHLELVGDLTSQKYLDTLDRFISRKGFCHDVYSDCGTNFIGASKEDQRSFIEFQNSLSKEIEPFLTSRQVQWHFSPPGAPHFNGLAEAAVKCMKFHLTRTIGNAKLTYEEFSTVLTRIEAVLNSRPISSISDNPNDFTALTPGHFLIGNALLSRPQPPTDDNPVKRHHLMEKMVQHFWQRFRGDVLTTMQIRPKWQSKQPNIKINDLVIIKDERFPTNQWPLGRIINLHPGEDGIIRVATVKTQNSMLKRPITKLCLVPVNDLGNSSS